MIWMVSGEYNRPEDFGTPNAAAALGRPAGSIGEETRRMATLNTFLIIAPLLAGIIALVYTIASNLVRVWVRHRLAMALLEKLQHEPDHAETLESLERLALPPKPGEAGAPWVDHRTTGLVLAASGLGTVLAAGILGDPTWKSGLSIGGVICLATGAILALLGFVTRYVERLPAGLPRKS